VSVVTASNSVRKVGSGLSTVPDNEFAERFELLLDQITPGLVLEFSGLVIEFGGAVPDK
jgi:hypothetical protein